jgi:antitoxin component YwqK of YwqJK toxin-antitoxin module
MHIIIISLLVVSIVSIVLSITYKLWNRVKRTYYESGELDAVTPYVRGKLHGIDKCYYKSGELIKEISYVDGEKL